jgi:polyisoprenoid-binding protein YceI
MKRIFFMAAVLAIAAPLVLAQTGTWTPDPNHTSVNFSVKHLTISNVRGHFGKVTGTIQFDQPDFKKSSVNVTIDVTGVDTGVTPRDNDLKSANYFDVANFPTANFTSTSVTKNSDGSLTINGNLTVHGVTKPVTLHADPPAGPINGNKDSKHMGFSATTTIDRNDFGIGAKTPSSIIGNEIKLEIDVDAVLQPPSQDGH